MLLSEAHLITLLRSLAVGLNLQVFVLLLLSVCSCKASENWVKDTGVHVIDKYQKQYSQLE